MVSKQDDFSKIKNYFSAKKVRTRTVQCKLVSCNANNANLFPRYFLSWLGENSERILAASNTGDTFCNQVKKTSGALFGKGRVFFTFSNLHFLALGVGFTAFTQRFACLTALSTVANSPHFCTCEEREQSSDAENEE